MFTEQFHHNISGRDFDYLVDYLIRDPRAFLIILTGLQGADEAERTIDGYQFRQEALAQAEAILAEGQD